MRKDPFVRGEIIADKYVVERVIGEGGMGVVVAARHRDLDELVAIKFLRADVDVSEDAIVRFMLEARAAVRIKSEHSATVFDVGTVPGRGPYIVMEYLEGRDVSTLLEQDTRIPMRRAVEYTLQACEAIALAHASGIVHRDIKPENLFLTRRADGFEAIKVLDFGISKLARAGRKSEQALEADSLLGSPMYMAPEQIRDAAKVDHRADIWSIGMVLYELLTGRVAFEAEGITKTCALVLEAEPPPISKYLPTVPPELEAIVARCLEKDPDRRYQSVAALATALLPFAPTRARLSVERSLRAAGTDVCFDSSQPPMSADAIALSIPRPPGLPNESTPLVPDARPPITTTSPPLGVSADDPQPRSGAVWVVLAGALAAAAILGFFALRRSPRVDAAAPPVVAATPVPAVAPSATVTIDSDPPGALVEHEGHSLGVTPLSAVLPAGPQGFRVSKEGFAGEAIVMTIDPNDDASTKQHVVLRPEPNATPDASITAAVAPAPASRAARGRTKAGSPAPAESTTASASAAKPGPQAPKIRIVDDSSRVKIVDDN